MGRGGRGRGGAQREAETTGRGLAAVGEIQLKARKEVRFFSLPGGTMDVNKDRKFKPNISGYECCHPVLVTPVESESALS